MGFIEFGSNPQTRTQTHTHKYTERNNERVRKNNHHLMSSSDIWVGSHSLQDWSWVCRCGQGGGWGGVKQQLKQDRAGVVCCSPKAANKLCTGIFRWVEKITLRTLPAVQQRSGTVWYQNRHGPTHVPREQQHPLSSRKCLLGKTDSHCGSNSLTLALSNPFYRSDLISTSTLFLLLRDITHKLNPPRCIQGHQPQKLFSPLSVCIYQGARRSMMSPLRAWAENGPMFT